MVDFSSLEAVGLWILQIKILYKLPKFNSFVFGNCNIALTFTLIINTK